jgi:hypothetical protein
MDRMRAGRNFQSLDTTTSLIGKRLLVSGAIIQQYAEDGKGLLCYVACYVANPVYSD